MYIYTTEEYIANKNKDNLQNRNRLTDIEKKLMVTKGETWGGINLEFEIKIYTLLYVKQINNKGLLYSTGKYSQYHIINYKGKESEKEYNMESRKMILMNLFAGQQRKCRHREWTWGHSGEERMG